ncbi:zinc knuckle [Colletotrichum abscissum]|uniref:Zinc knuckle n=1 Tax=Colletotrichum abscissum TaxID=1671311 RepID=A0A9Q0B8N5_9PEZI|nr:zinc knuckle [Colletotrichum abscissum]
MKARNTSRSGEVENLLLGLVYLFTIVTLSAVFSVEPDNEVSTSSSSARQHEAQDDEASASDSDSDYANNLDLIQVNLKRSPARMVYLIDHIPHTNLPPDVVAIQDPPSEFAWKSCPGYNIEYLPARELLGKDNPKTIEDPVPLGSFLVSQYILRRDNDS